VLTKSCFLFSLINLPSLQCANEITPANQSSNPVCGVQGSLHVFAGHSVALLVVCRTLYLHAQICWSLPFSNYPVIALNIIGWAIPLILLGVVYAVAEIAYTMTNHCSIRIDWIVPLLIIPVIIEVGIALIIQVATFIYCANVYLRSLHEPPLPSTNSADGTANSTHSEGSGRYPYRKAAKRIHKVIL